MAKVTKPEHGYPRIYGLVTTAHTKWGPVIKAWPRPRVRVYTPDRFYREAEFGVAAGIAAHPFSRDYVMAKSWVEGTDMVPRDILTMMALGTFYIFEDDSPDPLHSARAMNPNAQWILDGITDQPGSIIYRTELGWVHLPPANAGYVLTMANGEPFWAPATGGGGVANPWYTSAAGDWSGSSGATKMQWVVPGCDMNLLKFMFIVDGPADAVWFPAVYKFNVSTISNVVWTGDDQTITSDGRQIIASEDIADLVLLGGESYGIAAVRTDAGPYYGLNMPASNGTPGGVPFNGNNNRLKLDSVLPGVGDTVSVDTPSIFLGVQWTPVGA